jgi:arylsulfatase A-like enzyme
MRMIPALVIMLVLLAGRSIAERPPNLVFILTDNQGPWSLGCYGNADIKTPHIDRLAAGGVRFVNAFANNPVCSPNRATLLTGLMPSQHGVHCFLTSGSPQMGKGAYCVISEFPTLPKILKSHGYACGLVGKWHLGGNLTPQEGFTDEWVTMPHGATATFFDAEVIENGSVRVEPQHLTQYWTQRALQFIEKQKDGPFFLYLAYNGPYGLGPAQIKDHERAPHWGDYAEKDLPSFPRAAKPHPWLFVNRDFLNDITCIRRYAAEVSTIDDGVGAVMAKLKSLGLDENTLVVFAGDNGWAGGHHDIWGMGDHTRPLSAFDPTMRVPLIWHRPKHLKAGMTRNEHVSHLDFLPTVLAQMGLSNDLPKKAKLAGHDYSAMLDGETVAWDDTIYYEFENMRCIRTPELKYVQRIAGDPDEYYDLALDAGELNNLVQDSAKTSPAQVRLAEFFKEYADERYDLWHGGKSKAKAHVFPK